MCSRCSNRAVSFDVTLCYVAATSFAYSQANDKHIANEKSKVFAKRLFADKVSGLRL